MMPFSGAPYAPFQWYDSAGPYGCVSSLNSGGAWWRTRGMAHETCEMIADPCPFANQEIADSVADKFGAICEDTRTFTFAYNSCEVPGNRFPAATKEPETDRL